MINRVWVLGDAVIDLVPENANGYLKCPGGAPANVAVGDRPAWWRQRLYRAGGGKTASVPFCSRC